MNAPSPISPTAIKERYEFLCGVRDRIEERVASARANLRAAADEAELYRVKAMKAREELDVAMNEAIADSGVEIAPAEDVEDASPWFSLKKEIGLLASLYQKIKNTSEVK